MTHSLFSEVFEQRVEFTDGRNHPCAEDFDGPVMVVRVRTPFGIASERLMLVEQARAEYSQCLRYGFRKV